MSKIDKISTETYTCCLMLFAKGFWLVVPLTLELGLSPPAQRGTPLLFFFSSSSRGIGQLPSGSNCLRFAKLPPQELRSLDEKPQTWKPSTCEPNTSGNSKIPRTHQTMRNKSNNPIKNDRPQTLRATNLETSKEQRADKTKALNPAD